ncbi:hypothetical protein J3458_005089 [Metarhizium acridum]|uniref:uncharacterized protein n=1 Tax=Metarhizium acridum TaxID=92637 RepID=UPI001C6B046B|nr:hypothetical protein J3458_005089 [Metarhizium acridum]
MPGVVENIDSLVEDSITQNCVVFRAPGLKVVAAPWNYSFVKKVSRITQGTGRPYDASDAVAYLYQFITTRNSDRPVAFQTIQQWGHWHKALCPVEVLLDINDLFRRTYARDGITFRDSMEDRMPQASVLTQLAAQECRVSGISLARSNPCQFQFISSTFFGLVQVRQSKGGHRQARYPKVLASVPRKSWSCTNRTARFNKVIGVAKMPL